MNLFSVSLGNRWKASMINKYVKTQCGLDKYFELKARRGFFARARLCWFVVFATLRDFRKKDLGDGDGSQPSKKGS